MAKPNGKTIGKGVEPKSKAPGVEDEKTETTTPDADEAKAKKAEQAEKRKAMNEAKSYLRDTFLISDLGKTLDKKTKDAIALVCATFTRERGSSLLDEFKKIFTEVGTTVDEFELFKQTKMGRSEIRKKVLYLIKKADPKDRMYIAFNDKTESWSLLAVGEDNKPEDWK